MSPNVDFFNGALSISYRFMDIVHWLRIPVCFRKSGQLYYQHF